MPKTRKARRLLAYAFMAVIAGSCAAPLLILGLPTADSGVEHVITITASQYSYSPHRIVVDAGDTIRLRLASSDVVHGLYLEGHDLEAEVRPGRLGFLLRRPSGAEEPTEVEEAVVRAGRPGKYRYRCSVTCGTLHPFMQGELVVRPNRPFLAGVTGLVLVACGALGLGFVGQATRPAEPWRHDLLRRFPRLEWLVTRRWFQFAIVVPNVLVLFFFLIAGLFGSPIGNRNIIVTVVWILWWFLLITMMVPFGGRVWCLLCPLPFFGEWFARRRLIEVRREAETTKSIRQGSLNRRWPKALSSLWIQNFLFLAMCSVSTILVTRPALTAAVLGGMVVTAVAVHAVFRRRSFCRYLCPLNAWMSLYSMTAMTEVRPRDRQVCSHCRQRSCVTGTAGAWRCPWHEVPFKLERNNYCGLCMECVKACPNDNMTLFARPFCADSSIRRYDEAWMAFIMITLVVAYSVTLLGPWGLVKEWANVTEFGNWAGFALHSAVVWVVALILVPGVWLLASWCSRVLSRASEIPIREIFVRYSFVLVPLGLMAWAAFSFPLLMVNYTHITSSLSDPLGWGWDLFGTADQKWRPLLPVTIPYLQIPLLVTGLGIALARGAKIARELFPTSGAAALSLVPHGLVCTGFVLILLRLFVG